MHCPQCQHENSEVAKFCEECGTRLVQVCPSCGHEVNPSAKFCAECGTALSDNLNQDEVLERLNESLRNMRLVPPQSKRLACGDVGVGAMAALDRIVADVRTLLQALA